jgi:hypothetical protein
LRTVVHAQTQPASGIGAGGAKLCLEALGDRLQGREAVADLDRMDADAAGIVVIDRRPVGDRCPHAEKLLAAHQAQQQEAIREAQSRSRWHTSR